MAEVRKVRPGRGGHIAQAIARAMGESVRPITPGGSPDPSKPSETTSTAHSVTATSFVMSDEFLLPAPSEDSQPENDERSGTDAGA